MSDGLSPKLPLIRNDIDGAYALNKNYFEMIKQNFKMLILTNPGERVMDPIFGVGLKKYLFENDTPNLRNLINTDILIKTKKYLPFIEVNSINFNTENDVFLGIQIIYTILPLNITDTIELTN